LRKTAGAGVTPPNRIKLYREKMEGVDLFDKLTGLYRIWIQSRKWFWLLFRFSLKGNTANLWLLYRRVDWRISLLVFTRQTVILC